MHDVISDFLKNVHTLSVNQIKQDDFTMHVNWLKKIKITIKNEIKTSRKKLSKNTFSISLAVK